MNCCKWHIVFRGLLCEWKYHAQHKSFWLSYGITHTAKTQWSHNRRPCEINWPLCFCWMSDCKVSLYLRQPVQSIPVLIIIFHHAVPWLRLSLSCHPAGPPRVLPAGNLGVGGPQRPPGRPHGAGCGADGDVSPDVQTDGDWVEPGDRTLQPAGQWRPRLYYQGEADSRLLVWDRVFVINISLSSFSLFFVLCNPWGFFRSRCQYMYLF